MTCELCADEDGESCYPIFGVGPHSHRPGPIIGSTVLDEDQSERPGFTPSLDEPGMGTWWCPHCGEGKPDGAMP